MSRPTLTTPQPSRGNHRGPFLHRVRPYHVCRSDGLFHPPVRERSRGNGASARSDQNQIVGRAGLKPPPGHDHLNALAKHFLRYRHHGSGECKTNDQVPIGAQNRPGRQQNTGEGRGQKKEGGSRGSAGFQGRACLVDAKRHTIRAIEHLQVMDGPGQGGGNTQKPIPETDTQTLRRSR
jgi:hypothetical protein